MCWGRIFEFFLGKAPDVNDGFLEGLFAVVSIEDRWLSVQEICKHLGVSSDTVYKWIDQNAMPAHRMGRLWKFRKAEVDAWVKAGGAAAGAECRKKKGKK